MGRGEATPCLSVASRWEQAHTAAEPHELRRRRSSRPTAPGLMGPALQCGEACPTRLPKKALETPSSNPQPPTPKPQTLRPPKELKAPFPSSVRFLDCPTVPRAEARKGLSLNPSTVSLNFFCRNSPKLVGVLWAELCAPKSICWNPGPHPPHCDGIWRRRLEGDQG